VIRGGQPLQVELQPRLDAATGKYRIGVNLRIENRRVIPPMDEAVVRALAQPVREIRVWLDLAWTDADLDPGGVVRIARAIEAATGLVVIRYAVGWSTLLAILLALFDVIGGVAGTIKRRKAAPA
jgi:hypothetical protein